MNPYVIVTDSCADMVPGFAAENHIVELELTYTIGGVTRPCNDPSLSRPAFYDMVRAGEMPITAQVNIEDAVRALTPLLDAGSDLLCIMFSSALSGTYNSVRLAAEELAPQYPTQRIIVLDSLAASAGQGMLVALRRHVQGAGPQPRRERRANQGGYPPPGASLHRGRPQPPPPRRRVSKTAAVFGTMLGIKPLLHVDDAGRLIPTGKVRGRRNSLLGLVEGMARQMDPEKCDRFAISHGDCIDDAQFVADEVCRRFGLKDYTISYVGPVIGAHSGPGTVALFFYAKHK